LDSLRKNHWLETFDLLPDNLHGGFDWVFVILESSDECMKRKLWSAESSDISETLSTKAKKLWILTTMNIWMFAKILMLVI